MLLRTATPLLRRATKIILDFSLVNSIDNTAIAALAECVAQAHSFGKKLQIKSVSAEIKQILQQAPAPKLQTANKPQINFFERIGAWLITTGQGMVDFLQLLADAAYWGLLAPFRRRFPPPGATSLQAIRIGVDALPIIGLIAFLLGLIMAFQAAYQLRQFGANIFVANLVGISMVRELGPLMSAIMVAGRSGSAIAAELGTMTVGEEIDALRIMGINEIRFLVIPRLYAITITQPALTLLASIIGIFGGYLIGTIYLDLSPSAYIQQTLRAVTIDDLVLGLSKSLVFSWIIVLTGCFCGLRITGGARGVGQATIASVVASIFAIIVTDSIFATVSTLLK